MGKAGGKRPITAPVIRFMAKVKKTESGCWEWQGYRQPKGYGTFFTHNPEKEMMQAHRWSYEHHKGPIQPGLCIDHLCRNRACVNPDHLEAVTIQENVRRGDTGKHLKRERGPQRRHNSKPQQPLERTV